MADAEERRDKILRDYHELTRKLPNLWRRNVSEIWKSGTEYCENLTEIWFHCWKEIRVEIWWQNFFEAPLRLPPCKI